VVECAAHRRFWLHDPVLPCVPRIRGRKFRPCAPTVAPPACAGCRRGRARIFPDQDPPDGDLRGLGVSVSSARVLHGSCSTNDASPGDRYPNAGHSRIAHVSPIAPSVGLWSRWKRLARQAAEVQSEIVLFALYLLVVPLAATAQFFTRSRRQKSGWQKRETTDDGLAEARRQF
jgi:hypothetical protein